MPRYFYVAKSLDGEFKTESLEAKDKKELAKILHEEGYVLVKADVEETEKRKRFGISLSFSRGISLTEKLMFTRNLQVMISAGVSLPRCLTILSLQSQNKKFRKALAEVLEGVNKGENFSDGLRKYPDIFPDLFSSMVKVGEESGTLENVLKNLTFQMERENEMRGKIIGALIYPAVIITAMFGIGILMMIIVVPQLAQTFTDLEIPLPMTTKLVIATGNFLAKYWFLLPIIFLAIFFIFRRIVKTKLGKKYFDKASLKTPIISSIIRKNSSAQTLRTLSSLIVSGIPLLQALRIVSGTLGNVYFKEAIVQSIEKVRKGEKLSVALSPYQNLYPQMVIQMMEIGEETGQTSQILAKLADFYEEEVTNATKNLSTVIEPILMLVIGGAVGFFAVSMIQPMYSMLEGIK